MAELHLTYQFVRLLSSDGSWGIFEEDWKSQCADYGEDFEQYASASLPVLKEQATNPTPGVSVYALEREGSGFDSVVQATAAFIPGYSERVLRVRHMLMSPHFDFGDYGVDDYAKVLVRTFLSAAELAESGEQSSRHIKFHLRSPAEREFFTAMLVPLGKAERFTDVAIKGAWLHMTLKA